MTFRLSAIISLVCWGLYAQPALSDINRSSTGPLRDDPPPPAVIAVPAEIEFEVPQEVGDSTILNLRNESALRVDYTIEGYGDEGWAAQYFSNPRGASPRFGDLVMERVDDLIDFNWGNNGPGGGVPTDNFGARWTGYFIAYQEGSYQFRSRTDDGCRLFIDGQLVIDDWVDHGVANREGQINLNPGVHLAVFEYYENAGSAVAQLNWNTPNNRNFRLMPAFAGFPWINVIPIAGRINARESAEVTVAVFTDYLAANRDYEQTVVISTTDRITPRLEVPVRVRVTPWRPGAVRIAPHYLFLSFDEGGGQGEASLTLTNPAQGNYDFIVRIEGDNTDWLTVNPMRGRVGPGGELEVAVTFNGEGMDNGLYSLALHFAGDIPNMPEEIVPVSMAIGLQTGIVRGVVVDAATRDPIPSAVVWMDGHGIAGLTDDGGRFRIDVPVGRYRPAARATGYLRWLGDEFDLEAGAEVVVNPMLLHGELEPQPPRIEASVGTNDTLTFPLRLHNRGNGPLTWNLDINIPGVGRWEPWQNRGFVPVGEVVEDNRIAGVAFDGENFFVAGGNNGQNVNFIYVFNRAGEEVRRFRQPVESAFGMRDLAWDGRLLWGVDGGLIFGMDRNGDVQVQFDEPIRPSRFITWDDDRGLLWITSTTSDIVGMDRDGQIHERFRRPNGNLHIYGIAYYPEDPDGYQLYLFCNEQDGNYKVYKYNLENQDVRMVIQLPGLEGRAGGCHITGIYDPYHWVFIGVLHEEPIALGIWQLGPRSNWLRIAPEEGQIEPGATADLSVHFDCRGLPPDLVLQSDLTFRHDGFGLETVVPLRLTVTEVGGVSQRLLPCDIGWNLLSLNVSPADNGFVGLLAPLIDAGRVIMAKDGAGNFFWPERGFNQIESWVIGAAYWIKVSEPAVLPIIGEPIPFNEPLQLAEGWNHIAYLPRQPLEAPVALSGLGETLIIARDGRGRFFVPAYEFSNIGDMTEGFGYQLKVAEDVELVYSLGDGLDRMPIYSAEEEAFIASLSPTGSQYSLLLLGDGSLAAGTRIEALTPSGLVAGVGVVDASGRAGLALWGDDPSTAQIDGFVSGDPIATRVVGEAESLPMEWFEYVPPPDAKEAGWVADGWGVAGVSGGLAPVQFGLTSAWPNPFNDRLQLSFSLEQSGPVRLAVYDLAGRRVAMLKNEHLSAGAHQTVWNARGFASGLYILRLTAGGRSASAKVLLLR